MSDMLKSFGKKVLFFRKQKRLSQEELAELAGLHRTYIGQIESGLRNVAIKNICKLAKALNINPKDFF